MFPQRRQVHRFLLVDEDSALTFARGFATAQLAGGLLLRFCPPFAFCRLALRRSCLKYKIPPSSLVSGEGRRWRKVGNCEERIEKRKRGETVG